VNFQLLDSCFLLATFLENTEVAQIFALLFHGVSYVHIHFDKNGSGLRIGNWNFTNSSGHPAFGCLSTASMLDCFTEEFMSMIYIIGTHLHKKKTGQTEESLSLRNKGDRSHQRYAGITTFLKFYKLVMKCTTLVTDLILGYQISIYDTKNDTHALYASTQWKHFLICKSENTSVQSFWFGFSDCPLGS
jgi:hypothetical protein